MKHSGWNKIDRELLDIYYVVKIISDSYLWKYIFIRSPMPIHVAVTRKVHPGKEEEFKEALRRFLGESFIAGGVHGAGMITPIPGADSNEIGILRTFADEAERDTFYASKLFRDWEAYASTITEEPHYRNLSGLEAWFRAPGAPPRWKMALLTLCGVYPTSLFLMVTINPMLRNIPMVARTLVISLCMVGLLTWLIMPLVIKLAKKWLQRA